MIPVVDPRAKSIGEGGSAATASSATSINSISFGFSFNTSPESEYFSFMQASLYFFSKKILSYWDLCVGPLYSTYNIITVTAISPS